MITLVYMVYFKKITHTYLITRKTFLLHRRQDTSNENKYSELWYQKEGQPQAMQRKGTSMCVRGERRCWCASSRVPE